MADGKITGLGVVVENVPRWVVAIVALTVTSLLAWTVYTTQIRKPEQLLVTAKQANDELLSDMAEYAKHLGEKPEHEVTLIEDGRGNRLSIQQYVDWCLALVRTAPSEKPLVKLIVDLARDTKHEHAWFSLETPVYAAAGGMCLNPHPGEFRTSTVPIANCLVRVARQWPDGCAHWQDFDTCRGVWGAVNWTQCNH